MPHSKQVEPSMPSPDSHHAFVIVAFTILGAIAIVASGCGARSSSVEVSKAAVSPTVAKMQQCMAKVPERGSVFQASKPISVCRMGEDGKPATVSIRPMMKLVRRDNRLIIGQDVAFQVKPTEGTSKEDLILRNQKVSELLNQKCAPVVKEILNRSRINSVIQFKALTEGMEMSSTQSGQGSTGSVFDVDPSFSSGAVPGAGVQSSPTTTAKDAASEKDKSEKDKSEKDRAEKLKEKQDEADRIARQEAESRNAKQREMARLTRIAKSQKEFQVLLNLSKASDGGVEIADELKPVSSGSLDPQTDSVAFCAQVAVRVIEGLGVTTVRSCECRTGIGTCDAMVSKTGEKSVEKTSEKTGGQSKDQGQSLMKLQDPGEIVKSGRLTLEDVKQVIEPICSSL